MRKTYSLMSLLVLMLITGQSISQNQKHILGTPCKDCPSMQKSQPSFVQDGSGTIATSYTNTACGLNFTQASVRLNKRSFSGMTVPTGLNQPATYSISGIPNCAIILKAFLYSDVSANSAIPINATITNPASSTANYSMSMIGTHLDKCWGYAATYAYRADVTAAISGNGNYIISGIPASSVTGQPDTDGATLFIIYADQTQNYTGSIVIGDGCLVSQGAPITTTLTGFNVCGTPTLTSNFMLIADLQQIGNSLLQLNANSSNYTYFTASQNVWDFIQAPGNPALAGQTSAVYGNNDASDCNGIIMTGMYYRTTCMSCTATPGFSISTVATTSCTAGSATATPVGGVGPYSYTWNPTGGNLSTVSGVAPGIYTVAVKDASCGVITATVNIPGTPSVSVTNATLCSGNTATLTANGASTYSWNTGATTSQIMVSPTVNTNYTVTGANGSCTDTKTVSVAVNPSPTLNVTSSNSVICSGQTVTLTATGAASYSWVGGPASAQYVVSPTTNSLYYVNGYIGGCGATSSVFITVNSSPTVYVAASTTTLCSGGSATLTATGASTYSWSTGGVTAQIVVSPSVSTVYTLTGSNGSCSDTKTVSVTAGTTPVLSAATSNSFICAGQTVTLSASGALSYTYNPGGITGNPIAMNPTTSTTYTVLGSNGGPCIGMATITQSVSACTGIERSQYQKMEFGIYPNPNNGEFAVLLSMISENMYVEVYNSLGQLVIRKTVTDNFTTIDLQSQSDGVYHLRVTVDGKQVHKAKIIKN